MAKDRSALRAGIFIILSIALAFAVLSAIKGNVIESMQTRLISFSLQDDLGGLRVGDDVRIGGFKVGEVRNIELVAAFDPRLGASPTTAPSSNQAMLLVTITLPRRFQLRDGTEVGAQSTITGQSYLNFTSLGQGEPLKNLPLRGLPNPMAVAFASLGRIGPRVDSILTQVDQTTVPAINSVLAHARDTTAPKIDQAIDEYRGTATTATRFITRLHEYLEPIVKRYYQLADSASRTMNEFYDIIGGTGPDFRTTIKNLRSATGTIDNRLPGVFNQVSAILTDTHGAVKKASSALDDVQKTMANARDFTGDIAAIIAENRANLRAITRHMRATTLNLELASAELRSRPWRLLYQPKKDEVANMTLFDTAREFSRGANELNDAAQALQTALQNKRAEPAEVKQLMERVQKSFDNFNQVEQKLWNSVKE